MQMKISGKHIVLLACCAFITGCSNDNGSVDPVETAWIKTYGGSEDDMAVSVIAAGGGDYVVLGTTASTDGDITDKAAVENDFWLLKINSEGNVVWSKTYGGSGDDIGRSVIQTQDGGYAIAGYSTSSDGDASNNEGFHDHWILKLDAQGTIEWENSFGFAGHDHAYDLLQTADGGYFLSGFTDVTASGGQGNFGKSTATQHGVGEFWAIKTDPQGTMQWSRYFGGTNNDRSYASTQAADGGFILTGFSESTDFDISTPRGSYDFWVIKITATGDLAWERSFGGSEIEESYDIVLTADNNYRIAGQTYSTDKDITNPHGNSDFWTIEIDDNGNLIREKTYGGPDFDVARSISVTHDNGFLIAGNTKSTSADVDENFGENDIWLIKTDASGTLLWEQSFGGSGLDFGHDAIETEDRSIIVVGNTDSSDHHIPENKGKNDVIVVKLRQ